MCLVVKLVVPVSRRHGFRTPLISLLLFAGPKEGRGRQFIRETNEQHTDTHVRSMALECFAFGD